MGNKKSFNQEKSKKMKVSISRAYISSLLRMTEKIQKGKL